KLRRIVRQPLTQTQTLELDASPGQAVAPADPLVKQRSGDILECAGPRQQVVGLEDEADGSAAQQGEPVVVQRRDVDAGEAKRARRGAVEAPEDVHQR